MGAIWSLLIVLVGSIYELVAECFELFTLLSRTTTVEKSVYSNLIENFYLIIGVVMLFTIAFSLLKSMVSGDDDKGTENAGKVVKNFVTSIVILLLLPTIFSYAFAFQTAVVNQNTIGRIFGMNATGTSENSLASAGNDMANSVFTAFFTPTEEFCAKHQDEEKSCAESLMHGTTSLAEVIEEVNANGSFVKYSIFGDQVHDGDLSFNFLILIIAGLYLIYIIASFCLDLGLRLVKLVFYQIIAPIPVFMRVVPEGKLSNSFNEWVKITITCYIEVFLRLFIIYFSVFLVSAFLNNKGLGTLFDGSNSLIAKAIIVLSVVTFMKQAPQLIGDLFGIDSSNMKLGIMDKLAAGGMLAAGAFAGGALTTGTQNFTSKFKENRLAGRGKLASAGLALTKGGGSILAGTISGGVRSGRAGLNAKSFKDMKEAASSGSTAAVDARNKRANYKAAHGGFVGSLKGHVKDFGNSAKNFAFDESIEGLTRESKSMGDITSSYNTFNDTIENLLEKEQAKGTGSVFKTGGTGNFNLANYDEFDKKAQELAHKRARFNAGALSADDLRKVESEYIDARDKVRNELMNMALVGSNGAAYGNLSDKGKAALKDSLVNAESLQATILANASTKVVQDIMGDDGNKALSKIINGTPLNVDDFEHNHSKLKDAAKVAQGVADIKIAEMNKEQAAKGDNK